MTIQKINTSFYEEVPYVLNNIINAISKKYLTVENTDIFLNGIKFYTKYDPIDGMPIIDYSKVTDKVSLGQTLASSFTEGDRSQEEYQRLAVVINHLHDGENKENEKNKLTASDVIRQTFAKSSDFKTKYNLIAYANGDLYTSTFLALNDNLPKDVVNQIKMVDPEGNNSLQFILQIANRNKLNPLLKENPGFFREQIVSALSNRGNIMQNTAFLTNSFLEYYKNPDFAEDKVFFEKFLVDKYNTAEDRQEKGSYAFLLRLDDKTNNIDVKKINDSLPPIPDLKVPEKFTRKDTVSMKAYYYPDENRYGQTVGDYQKEPYNMTLVKEDKENQATELEKILDNGKKLRVVLTTKNSDVEEAVNGDEFDIISHRGHSFHLTDTFNSKSTSEKILYFGSCGSSGSYPKMQEDYPNTYIISDDDTGQGLINNYASFNLMKKIAEGETNREGTKSESAKKNGMIFPHEKSRLLYRFVNQVDAMNIAPKDSLAKNNN